MTTVDFYATSAAGRDFSIHGGLVGPAIDAMELLRKAVVAGELTPATDPGLSVSATAVPGLILRKLLEPLRLARFGDGSLYRIDPAFATGADLLDYIGAEDVYEVSAVEF